MSYYNADFFPQSIAYFSWIIQKLLVHYQKKLLLKNKIYSYICNDCLTTTHFKTQYALKAKQVPSYSFNNRVSIMCQTLYWMPKV